MQKKFRWTDPFGHIRCQSWLIKGWALEFVHECVRLKIELLWSDSCRALCKDLLRGISEHLQRGLLRLLSWNLQSRLPQAHQNSPAGKKRRPAELIRWRREQEQRSLFSWKAEAYWELHYYSADKVSQTKKVAVIIKKTIHNDTWKLAYTVGLTKTVPQWS